MPNIKQLTEFLKANDDSSTKESDTRRMSNIRQLTEFLKTNPNLPQKKPVISKSPVLSKIDKALLDIKNDLKKESETEKQGIKKLIKETVSSEVGKINIPVPKDGESIKGDDGHTPIKGQDYFTSREISEFKKEVTPIKGQDYFTSREISEFKKEITPIKGQDYFTSREVSEFKKEVTPIKGVDYFDGKDASPDTPNQVRDKLETLIGDERLDRGAIKGLDAYVKDSISTLYVKTGVECNIWVEKISNKTLSYDVDGNLETIAIAGGRTYTFTYDVNGNLDTKADGTYTWTYGYDVDGNLETITVT